VSRVLALASGKGGAGKTSVCVNLAFALARGGRRVLILDADLGLSNVDVLLGISPPHSLEHVLFEGLPLAAARVAVSPLVDVISGGSGVPRLAELSREARRRLTAEFSGLSGYDYVLVDNSPGISGQVLSLCLACNEVAVVVNPEAASVVDAYALVKLLRAGGLSRPPLLVFNRVSGEVQGRAVFERFSATARERLGLSCILLGCVPEDRAVASAAARQTPLLLAHPASEAAKAFLALALSLEARPGGGAAGRVLQQNPGVFFERAVVGALERGGGRPGPAVGATTGGTAGATTGATAGGSAGGPAGGSGGAGTGGANGFSGGSGPDSGEAGETARLALAGIDAALSRLSGLDGSGPGEQASALAQARAELARLRRTLAGRWPGAEAPPDEAGTGAGDQAPPPPAWLILCPDPFRAELLCEVAGEAGLSTVLAGGGADQAEAGPGGGGAGSPGSDPAEAPGAPAGILAWDPDPGAAGELARRWPAAPWVLVGDPRDGDGLAPGPAVERVAAPFRVEEVLAALKRAGRGSPPGLTDRA
jgi:flagellar biosynthesis protein FlhG